jgi:hypothetical protein
MQLYGEAMLEAAQRRAAVERVTREARRQGSMEAPAFAAVGVRRRRQARKQKP